MYKKVSLFTVHMEDDKSGNVDIEMTKGDLDYLLKRLNSEPLSERKLILQLKLGRALNLLRGKNE
jgi:hypothetical protein